MDANHQSFTQINTDTVFGDRKHFIQTFSNINNYTILTLALDGTIISGINNTLSYFGYSSEEILGKSYSLFYPEPLGLQNLNLELLYVKQVGCYVTEDWRVRKDGSFFLANEILSPIYDSSSTKAQLIGFSKFSQDITLQKTYDSSSIEHVIASSSSFDKEYTISHSTNLTSKEKDLLETAENLKESLASAEVGTWRWEIINDIIVWDDQLYSLFGMNKSSSTGPHISYWKFLERIDPADRKRVTELTIECLAKPNDDYRVEYRVFWPDGSERTVTTRARLQFNKDGLPHSLVGVCWDITKEKTLEAEKLQAMIQSESDQRERAQEAEMHRKQLQELMHTLCHEIKTPLTGIQGSTEWLKEVYQTLISISKNLDAGMLDPKTFEQPIEDAARILNKALDISTECGLYLNDVVDEILEHSYIASGKITVNNKLFKPSEVVDSVLKIEQGNKQLASKKLYLISHIPTDDICIYGDSTKFKTIVLNLICNAIKFTNNGGITVSLVYKQQCKNNKRKVQLIVSDTGDGLTDEEKNQLFEKYLDKGRKQFRVGCGSGLGLYIVKGYIEALQGKIDVSSELGKGTTFKVTLWFGVASPQQMDEQLNTASQAEQLEFTARDPRHILVVEDNVVNQKILCSILKKKGHTFQIANDGKEAVSIAEQFTFDLILMDIQMPILNGFEATRVIRAIEAKDVSRGKTPIIVLSGNLMPGDREDALVCGMQDFLHKPYKPNEIFEKIDFWTKKPPSPGY